MREMCGGLGEKIKLSVEFLDDNVKKYNRFIRNLFLSFSRGFQKN